MDDRDGRDASDLADLIEWVAVPGGILCVFLLVQHVLAPADGGGWTWFENLGWFAAGLYVVAKLAVRAFRSL